MVVIRNDTLEQLLRYCRDAELVGLEQWLESLEPTEQRDLYVQLMISSQKYLQKHPQLLSPYLRETVSAESQRVLRLEQSRCRNHL